MTLSRRRPGAGPGLVGFGEKTGERLDGSFLLFGGHREVGGREQSDLACGVAPADRPRLR